MSWDENWTLRVVKHPAFGLQVRLVDDLRVIGAQHM